MSVTQIPPPPKGRAPRPRPRAIVSYVPDPYEELREEIYEGQEVEDEEPTSPGFLQVCWPAVFGIMLAVIAPKLHSYVTEQFGDLGERLVFPYMLLAGRPELGLGEELQKNLPELLEWLAFPVLGLYVSLSMKKRVRFGMAVAQVLFVNGIAAFVLWILSKPGASHGM